MKHIDVNYKLFYIFLSIYTASFAAHPMHPDIHYVVHKVNDH